MTYETRLATADDGEALAAFSAESFGYPAAQSPFPHPQEGGRKTYVTTEGDRILATVRLRDYESWFWGARIPTVGIASVKVRAEERGSGLLTTLFERSLAEAVEHGAAISTLYATAPGIYRKFGYETFASYDQTVIPTTALARVRPTVGSVRRAAVDDIPLVRRLYSEWAQAHNGPLTRDGASFPVSDADLLDAFQAITIAYDEDGTAAGYALWDRADGYDSGGILKIHDLVALSDHAMRQLLSMFGTFAPVAPRTLLDTSQPDLAQIVLTGDDWTVQRALPYGIAILDVARALALRTYPNWLDLDLTFAVHGLPVPDQDGAYRLQVNSGAAQIDSVEHAHTNFTARGLALRFAGTHNQTDLRRAGLLTGDTGDDSHWDATFSGRQPHIRDYF
ncbi:GNAT family N-acetyltransferase [Demetria terragena]|uniref:GNAT family N-acetyltransferase n=1 Tax=Demetria terragena TaxID=63959 RepID=UPI00038272E2|nr:GNAT family N-acetyltransferase [Demetria terragena]